MTHQLNVMIERDEDGWLVASIPELRGCHTQARTMDELIERITEAAELCLEVSGNDLGNLEFVGIQRIAVEG